MKIKTAKGEFKAIARKFVLDPTLQRIETKNYTFTRIDQNITVKFHNIKGLTGYFDFPEIKDQKGLSVILRTLEKELDKKTTEKKDA